MQSAGVIVGEWMDADQLGLSQRDLRAALRAGSLVRVRRGRYLPGAADPELMAAARLGCRLDCVSFLRALGVFILDSGTLHVLAPNGSSRLPAPGRTWCVTGDRHPCPSRARVQTSSTRWLSPVDARSRVQRSRRWTARFISGSSTNETSQMSSHDSPGDCRDSARSSTAAPNQAPKA